MPDFTVRPSNRTFLDARFAVGGTTQSRLITGITFGGTTYWADYGFTTSLSFKVKRPSGVTQSNPRYTIEISDLDGSFRRQHYDETSIRILDAYVDGSPFASSIYRLTTLDIVSIEVTDQRMTIQADLTRVYDIKVPLRILDIDTLGDLII